MSSGNLSRTKIVLTCILAFALALAHSGSTILAYYVLDESPFLIKSVQVCSFGAVEQKDSHGVIYLAAPVLICCVLFLSHDLMSLRLLRL